MSETVCILTAGKGSRLGDFTLSLNKCLLPIKKKAAISHIIDKFSVNDNYIVAIGYKGYQVKNFLKINYPRHKFKFVKVLNYDGKNSGPGHSLHKCKRFLKKPFYFVSCDTIWNKKKIPKNQKINWMAVSEKNFENSENFCNLVTKKNLITNLYDKIDPKKKHYQFSGLAYIYDWKIFWSLFKEELILKEIQVSSGFKNLIINKKVYIKKIDWYDIGTLKNYKKTIESFELYDFSKKSEFIYQNEKNIIKFYNVKQKMKRILNRSKDLKKFVPKNIKIINGFLCQDFVKGNVLYDHLSPKLFLKLLDFLFSKFWKINENVNIDREVKNFYKKKTYSRVNLYLKKYKKFEHEKINDLKYPKILDLLKKINWSILENNTVVSRFHGDLQFDNIICNKKLNKFTLIDWRDSFEGNNRYGDLYYDLAKLFGGMKINYSEIKKKNFYFFEKNLSVEFSMPEIKAYKSYETIFKKQIEKRKFLYKKVKLLRAIIFLNMCPLHHYPFDIMLFNLAKKELLNIINQKK